MEKLEIFRGDTFDIKVLLTRDAYWVLTGSTVEMSFKFNDDVIHTFTGTITSDTHATDKYATFNPTEAAVATVRQGIFDVQVDDGSHPITHMKGTVKILQDVTP